MGTALIQDEARLIFFGMFALVLLAMAPGVDDDEDEDQEANSKEEHHPGTIFPDLLNSIRKLGPIHFFGQYTAENKK